MENKTILGILAIVLGVIAIIFPLISLEFIQIVAGLAVVILGIYWIIRGIHLWNSSKAHCVLYVLVGIFAILFGSVLTGNLPFFIVTSSFILYVVGFLMIMFGIADLFIKNAPISKTSAVLFVLFGIVLLMFANLLFENPLYLAILIGIALIAEGITLIFEPIESIEKIEPKEEIGESEPKEE